MDITKPIQSSKVAERQGKAQRDAAELCQLYTRTALLTRVSGVQNQAEAINNSKIEEQLGEPTVGTESKLKIKHPHTAIFDNINDGSLSRFRIAQLDT